MEERTLDMRETLAVLVRRRYLIAAIVGVTAIAALLMSSGQPKVYRATARLVVRPVIPPAAFSNAPSGRGGVLGRDVSIESQAEIAGSPLVAERVKDELGLPQSPQALAAKIDVRVVTDELLEVRASSSSPKLAAALANTFADEYLTYEQESVMRTLEDLGADYEARITKLEQRSRVLDEGVVKLSADVARLRGRRATTARDAEIGRLTAEMERMRVERNEILIRLGNLRARYEDIRSNQGTTAGGGEVLSYALVPSAPASPNKVRDGVIGLFLGAVLGVGAAFLRHHLDDRIRTSHDIVRTAGVPVIGEIPRARRWRRKREAYLATLGEPGSPAAEAYRSMRQSLTAMGVGRSVKTVLVTSGGKGAGKSSTAANLAVAFSQAGYRVAVVSADLRRPRVQQFFGMANDVGFSEVLRGELAVANAAVPTAVVDLAVVPSGALPRNPAALLDGRRLREAIDELRATVDVVIIDAPPIASGADAMVLAPCADITLLVVRREFARAGGVVAAVGGLMQAGAARVVAVLNMAGEGITTRGFEYEPPAIEVAPAVAAHPANGNGAKHENGRTLVTVADVATIDAATEQAPRARRTAPRRRAAKPTTDE